MATPSARRSTDDMMAELVVLLSAHAKDHGLVVPDGSTDVEKALMIARSIRFGWRPTHTLAINDLWAAVHHSVDGRENEE
jgi:hypothetical protein